MTIPGKVGIGTQLTTTPTLMDLLVRLPDFSPLQHASRRRHTDAEGWAALWAGRSVKASVQSPAWLLRPDNLPLSAPPPPTSPPRAQARDAQE